MGGVRRKHMPKSTTMERQFSVREGRNGCHVIGSRRNISWRVPRLFPRASWAARPLGLNQSREPSVEHTSRRNTCRKGACECQTDSPRRPHLRPRKGTNLGAGNPSSASCSASSRCQPCAPLARLKKYFQSFRANPFNQHTSAGSSMSARSTWRSLGVVFTPSEARSGEVEGGEVDLGMLFSPVPR